MSILGTFFRRCMRGEPLFRLASLRNLLRVFNVLEDIEGQGCRIAKPVNAEGRGWRIIVDGTSDVAPPDGAPPPWETAALCDADDDSPASLSTTRSDNPTSGGRAIRLYGFRTGQTTSMPNPNTGIAVLVRDERTSPPTLRYIPASDFGGGSGVTGTITVVEDVSWDSTYHKLVKKTRQWTFSNGCLASVSPDPFASPAAAATTGDIIDFVPEQV